MFEPLIRQPIKAIISYAWIEHLVIIWKLAVKLT